jgi:predicted Zn-ribbon and HTH transcriptional regulator
MEGPQLHCTNCSYTFTPKSHGKMPDKCPYCNQPETIEPVKTAQDLLDETEDVMGQRE